MNSFSITGVVASPRRAAISSTMVLVFVGHDAGESRCRSSSAITAVSKLSKRLRASGRQVLIRKQRHVVFGVFRHGQVRCELRRRHDSILVPSHARINWVFTRRIVSPASASPRATNFEPTLPRFRSIAIRFCIARRSSPPRSRAERLTCRFGNVHPRTSTATRSLSVGRPSLGRCRSRSPEVESFVAIRSMPHPAPAYAGVVRRQINPIR